MPSKQTSGGGGGHWYDPTIFEKVRGLVNEADVEDFVNDLVKDKVDMTLEDLEDDDSIKRVIDIEETDLKKNKKDFNKTVIKKYIQKTNYEEESITQEIMQLRSKENVISKKIYELSKMGMMSEHLRTLKEIVYRLRARRKMLEKALYKAQISRDRMTDILENIETQDRMQGADQNVGFSNVVSTMKLNNIILFVVGAVIVGYIVYKVVTKK